MKPKAQRTERGLGQQLSPKTIIERWTDLPAVVKDGITAMVAVFRSGQVVSANTEPTG